MAAPLIIMSGPSGAGKTTTTDHLLTNIPELSRTITVTTRGPRPGEVHGIHYFFVSQKSFDELVVAQVFLEINKFGGYWYATPRSLLTFLDRGRARLVLPDINGARVLKKHVPSAVCIWLEAPLEILAQRLVARNSESIEQQSHRLEIARREIQEAHESNLYEHIVDMTNFVAAEEAISNIIKSAIHRR